MTIYREEIFGPVLVVLRTRTLDEAIALINACRFGNRTAMFTSSSAVARRFEESVDVGMVGINVPIPVPMAFFFVRRLESVAVSRFACVRSFEGMRFYSKTKAITSRWPLSDTGTAGIAHANAPVK